ncbi:MAG: DUF6572 domain-containing protein [Verrucomicrobiota bacterium]
MPLHNPNVIDFLALDPTTGEVVLGITEARPWDGTDRRAYELQEKVNTYLGFVLGGEMLEKVPQIQGKALRMQLDCKEEPDSKMEQVISMINKHIDPHGIKFAVNVVPDLDEAEGCCGGGEGGGCCGGHDHHSHGEEGGCCGGHDHRHDEEDGCCGGQGGGGCGCS